MRISTRGRYALRAMVDLALHTDDAPILRRDIAARQEISADYVAQLFRQLGTANIVRGIKGPGGGYTLARDAITISVGDIVRAVEGPIAVVNCVTSDDNFDCRQGSDCVTRTVWQRVNQAIEDALDKISLADLRDEAQLQISEPST
ncbi:MAG: Rrf2 family transcriptional regulator [Chloroflexi bacterium]|nr:Rrf2 family transcriptional regulator [Chloroflexota bacterium]